MDRLGKTQVVQQLKKDFEQAEIIVITQQSGLSAAEVFELRNKAHASGANYKVTKNRLARIAVQGTSVERLLPYFKGVTAITHSRDPVAAAKVTVEYSNQNDKFQVICGIMGEEILTPAMIKELASLPSLETLRAKILGLLGAPATKIAQTVQAVPAGIARLISAHVEKQS